MRGAASGGASAAIHQPGKHCSRGFSSPGSHRAALWRRQRALSRSVSRSVANHPHSVNCQCNVCANAGQKPYNACIRKWDSRSMQMLSAGAVPGSTAAAASSLDPEAIVNRVLAGGTQADSGFSAQADLLAACLAQRTDATDACGAALLRLAGVDPPIAGACDLHSPCCTCKLCTVSLLW